MKITEQVVLEGSMEDTLRDAALLRDFLTGLPTYTATGATEAHPENIGEVTYKNRLLSHRGRSLTVPKQQDLTLSLLVEAQGEVVSAERLQQLYLADGSLPTQHLVILSRLRKGLADKVPSVSIETVGDGYRLRVA